MFKSRYQVNTMKATEVMLFSIIESKIQGNQIKILSTQTTLLDISQSVAMVIG